MRIGIQLLMVNHKQKNLLVDNFSVMFCVSLLAFSSKDFVLHPKGKVGE